MPFDASDLASGAEPNREPGLEFVMNDPNNPSTGPAGHYSKAVRSGDLIFTAGHLPERAGEGAHERLSFEEQVRSAFDGLFATLAASGAAPADVIKVTCYVVGVERWGEFNRLFAAAFGDHRPARTVLPVPELHYGCLVELEAIARRPSP